MQAETLAALGEAMDREYKALATYRAIVERFGAVAPFPHLIQEADRQVDALLRVYTRNRIDPPRDRWARRLPSPETLGDACRNAIDSELESANTYDRLVDEVEDPAIRLVLSQLDEACRYRRRPLLQALEQRSICPEERL